MQNKPNSRRGVSLIEVLIVIAIIGILIGLLLSVIQKVRMSSLHTQSKNNIRQIMLAVHQEAGIKDGTIDQLSLSFMPKISANCNCSLFYRIVPYLGVNRIEYQKGMSGDEVLDKVICPYIKTYHNPADPSWDYDPALARVRGKCSYAFNMLAISGSFSFASSFQDGTSHTIAIGDKYFAQASADTMIAQTCNIYHHLFDPIYPDEIYGDRRATFADAGWHDVLPVTDPISKTTRASVPGKTFQVRPRPDDADPSILQTPFAAGLTVGMFDGSVRTISPSVAETVFWGQVTPSASEVVME